MSDTPSGSDPAATTDPDVYYPLARARELEGSVEVEFEIDGERRATRIETYRSCGHGILDRAALDAVAAAAPLPYVYGRLVIPIEFDLRGHH